MIGDGNGYTDEIVEVSADNPFIERYCKLLNNLQPTEGYWGIVLSFDRLYFFYKENQITLDEYNFLARTLFPVLLEDAELITL